MNEQSLYNILGIDTDATQDEIKKQYKKLSMDKHPDRGGTTEEFQAIKHAYEILSDPEKRKRYDETGEHGMQQAPDPVQQIILQSFMAAIDLLLSKSGVFAQMSSHSSLNDDLISSAKKKFEVRVSELERGIKQVDSQIEMLVKIKDRVSRTDEKTNLFEGLVLQKIEIGKQQLKSLSDELEYTNAAIDEIDCYQDNEASERVSQAFDTMSKQQSGIGGYQSWQ